MGYDFFIKKIKYFFYSRESASQPISPRCWPVKTVSYAGWSKVDKQTRLVKLTHIF